jgi:S1 RNA binding domain protein
MPIEIGCILEGMVTGITSFGAFVQLPEGRTGLVHISEVADDYVKDIKNYLKERDRVSVKVLAIDQAGKISLSIKQAQKIKKSVKPIEIDWNSDKSKATNSGSFEDQLLKFMKDSDERQQQLKKSQESKRGGGGFKKADQARG